MLTDIYLVFGCYLGEPDYEPEAYATQEEARRRKAQLEATDAFDWVKVSVVTVDLPEKKK